MKKQRKWREQFADVSELRFGGILLLILLIIAIFAPVIAPYDPSYLNDDILAPPSAQYWFGTDNLGRDVFSMVVFGARTSLSIGIIAAFLSAVIGITVGAFSGYFGGWFDRIVNEIISVFMMMPTFFLIIIVVAIYGSSLTNIILAIGLTSWTGTARMMRSQAISIKEQTFVKALVTLGESDTKILFRHIIPNGIYPIITDVTTAVSSAILFESSLSFLGLGDPTLPSWGRIIYNGKGHMMRAGWISFFGGLFLMLTVFAFHLIAEGFNKVTNPLRSGGN